MIIKIKNNLSNSEVRWQLDERGRDIVSGVLVVVFAAFVYFQTGGLPKGASAFPKGISFVLLLSGLLLILRSWRTSRGGEPLRRSYSWKLFSIAVPLWCTSVWLIRPLDFFIVAPIFLAVLSWIMVGAPRSMIEVLRPLAFGIAVSAALWGVFVQVLGVALP